MVQVLWGNSVKIASSNCLLIEPRSFLSIGLSRQERDRAPLFLPLTDVFLKKVSSLPVICLIIYPWVQFGVGILNHFKIFWPCHQLPNWLLLVLQQIFLWSKVKTWYITPRKASFRIPLKILNFGCHLHCDNKMSLWLNTSG